MAAPVDEYNQEILKHDAEGFSKAVSAVLMILESQPASWQERIVSIVTAAYPKIPKQQPSSVLTAQQLSVLKNLPPIGPMPDQFRGGYNPK